MLEHLPCDAQLAIYSYASFADLRTFASLRLCSSTPFVDETLSHDTGLERDAVGGHLRSLGVRVADKMPVLQMRSTCQQVVADERRLRAIGFPRLWAWIDDEGVSNVVRLQHMVMNCIFPPATCEAASPEHDVLPLAAKNASLFFRVRGVVSQWISEIDDAHHKKKFYDTVKTQLQLPVVIREADFIERMLEAAIEDHSWPAARETTEFLISASTQLDIFRAYQLLQGPLSTFLSAALLAELLADANAAFGMILNDGQSLH